jgi:hypothetical protein
VIFVHFYEMFISVRLSIPLFRLFHVLRWARKGTKPINTYYFQLRARAQLCMLRQLAKASGIAGGRTG